MPGGVEADTTREGGGTIDLVRADRPLVFASPTSLAFGFVRPGALDGRQIALTDAGGGAGAWTVSTTLQQPANGVTVSVPPAATVPGPLVITATAPRGSGRGDAHRLRRPPARRGPQADPVLVPRRRAEARPRHDDTAHAHRAPTRATRVGTRRWSTRTAIRTTRGSLGVSRTLLGPEQVFRVSRDATGRELRRRRHPRSARARRAARRARRRREPAARRDRAPVQRESVPARVRHSDARRRSGPPRVRATTTSSSTAARPPGPAAFTFRFWIDDTTPPRLKLISTARPAAARARGRQRRRNRPAVRAALGRRLRALARATTRAGTRSRRP